MDPEGIHLEAPTPWGASFVYEVKNMQQSFHLLFNQSSRPSTIDSLLHHIKIRVHFNRLKDIIKYSKRPKRVRNTVRDSSPSRIRSLLKTEIISSLVKILARLKRFKVS